MMGFSLCSYAVSWCLSQCSLCSVLQRTEVIVRAAGLFFRIFNNVSLTEKHNQSPDVFRFVLLGDSIPQWMGEMVLLTS